MSGQRQTREQEQFIPCDVCGGPACAGQGRFAVCNEYCDNVAKRYSEYESTITTLEQRVAESKQRELNWTECAAEYARGSDFYQGLLDQCATHLGPNVYVADDGSIQDSPLRLKIPEMVQALTQRIATLEAAQTWVPVSERLPEVPNDGCRFLVVRKIGDYAPFVTTGYYGHTSFSDELIWQPQDITHWMPLLAPPAAQGEKQ